MQKRVENAAREITPLANSICVAKYASDSCGVAGHEPTHTIFMPNAGRHTRPDIPPFAISSGPHVALVLPASASTNCALRVYSVVTS